MTAALDAVRLLVGFAVGYVTARAAGLCPICGRSAVITALCARCAPVVHPRKEKHP